jgi:peptidyl-prolyl cis-trans isomerase C
MIAGRSARSIGAAVIIAAAACRSDDARPPSGSPPPRAGSLPAGIVARAGSADVHAAFVARVAAAQRLSLERARDAAVREALFASEARARELDRQEPVRSSIQASLARLLLRDLLAAAKQAGPVTEDELHDATQFYWLEMDRPPGFRAVHAVVRLDGKSGEAQRARAMEIAEAIRRSVEPLGGAAEVASPPPPSSAAPTSGAPRTAPSDPLVDAFKRAASAVPHDGFDVVIEPLPPVAADGRVLEPGDRRFDPAFARAAASLERRGDLSPPTASSFGVHVIMLLERLPPVHLPEEERRARVHDEVIAARARAAERALLERAREASSVDRSVDALLALIPVDR